MLFCCLSNIPTNSTNSLSVPLQMTPMYVQIILRTIIIYGVHKICRTCVSQLSASKLMLWQYRCSMMIDSDHTCPFRTHILLGHANFPQEFEDFVGPPLLAQPKPTSAVPLIRWIRRKHSTGKADTITNTPQFSNGTGPSSNTASPVNNPNDKVRLRTFLIELQFLCVFSIFCLKLISRQAKYTFQTIMIYLYLYLYIYIYLN